MESTLSGPTVVSTHKQSPMMPEFWPLTIAFNIAENLRIQAG